MRRLMLLRHAKSAWPDGLADHERPLAERGRQAVMRMGRFMAREDLRPDLAIVSSARRAQGSWELANTAFSRSIAKLDEPRLYNASVQAILQVIRETGAHVGALLLVGHNPGFQQLAIKLVAPGRRSALRRKYPTAGFAVIDFDVEDWRDVREGAGQLQLFETPKSIDVSRLGITEKV